jgi:chromosome segregation protein
MHLRAIKLRGFKSFPDPVEMRLEPGVAVVVGPNGSGKSNVADAIVWAAGSMAPSELRAERPDDVLFAGSAGRNPADSCEVELLFENPEGAGPLPYAELSIKRRLQRGGEGQYLVNGASVRRLDLVEILAELGLGPGMHSIIGQGRVEEILGSKPGERRALIEEAAGLGKFKSQRHRAELKLARVAVQVERARDLEAEVKGRLRPLALQATAAERAEKLGREIAGLRARIAQLDLTGLEQRLVQTEERKRVAVEARRRAEERLDSLLAERNQAEEELADAAGKREASTAALYRLRSAAERLELRRETAEGLAGRLRLALDELANEPAELRQAAQLEHAAAEGARKARAAAVEREALAERTELARERLAALERTLAEREGLPPAARALAEQGERLALSLLDVEPGRERAVAAALGPRASALVAPDAHAAFALLERARAAGLGSLRILVGRDPSELVRTLPVVSKEELLAMRVAAVTPEGYGYDPASGELWFAGEAAEAVLLELEARRRSVADELRGLEAELAAATSAASDAEAAARRTAAAWNRIAPSTHVRRADPARLARVATLAERLAVALGAAAASLVHFEAPLRAEVESGASRASHLAQELRRLGAAEAEVRRAAAEAGERVAGLDVEAARLHAEAEDARRRLVEAAHEPADGEDRDELAERVERLERRRFSLGQVNPLAKEEYAREKERLEELTTQRADLEASLDELAKLRDELTETVERRFAETFDAVRTNFAEVASTLFAGGEGRLRMTEPTEDEDEPGIEIELRPAGKKVTRLSLLSGGEKALGAISFLFALFLARPCPFYLLDEVEAALDDTNIGRFVELLRRYADRAQFVVITHQKRTMEAADVLYGVTMGGDGISQIVSRRLPREDRPIALVSA